MLRSITKIIIFAIILFLVKNLSQNIILGTPFLTQIYHFQVDDKGIYTKVLGTKVTFNFLSAISQKEIHMLQQNFISQQINFIHHKEYHVLTLQKEINYGKIESMLGSPLVQIKINELYQLFQKKIYSNLPNIFWERKKHRNQLPYEKDFKERDISTKARPIQMNHDLLEHCKKEINDLLSKKFIQPSKLP